MDQIHFIRAAGFGLVILGSIYLGLAPFFTRAWKFSPWVRIACWMIGLVGLAWGTISFLLLFRPWHLTHDAVWALICTKLTLGGIALGLFALLFLSGEIMKALRRPATRQDLTKRSS